MLFKSRGVIAICTNPTNKIITNNKKTEAFASV